MLYRIKKLFKRKPKTTRNAIIHLNNGDEIEMTLPVEEMILPKNLTADTVWKFPTRNGKRVNIVAGDRIAYIEAIQ